MGDISFYEYREHLQRMIQELYFEKEINVHKLIKMLDIHKVPPSA